MKILRGALILVVLAFTAVLSGGSVSAASEAATGQIRVKARVLPHHTITLDEQGAIKQIASNTTEDVTEPRVYLLTPVAVNQQPLTPEIYEEYRRLVPPGTSKVGILYEHSPLADLLVTFEFKRLSAHLGMIAAISNH